MHYTLLQNLPSAYLACFSHTHHRQTGTEHRCRPTLVLVPLPSAYFSLTRIYLKVEATEMPTSNIYTNFIQYQREWKYGK